MAHKFVSAIVLAAVLGGGYWGYQKISGTPNETRYVLAAVGKTTIIPSITGTGQVSASNQVDVKPKVSGEVLGVNVTNGQEVAAGTVLLRLDDTDAQKAVRDADANLQSAELALQKLQQPPDALSLTQAQNALDQATNSLTKAYDDGFNSVSNAFLDLPGMMSGLNDVLYGTTLAKGQQDNLSAYTYLVVNYDESVNQLKDDVTKKYQTARQTYDKNFGDYKAATRFSDPATITALISETYETTKTIADAIKSSTDLLNFVQDRLSERNLNAPSLLATHLNTLAGYTSQTNAHLVDLYNIKNTITTTQDSITEKTEALAKLKAGADPLDIASQQLSITQRQNALIDAKNALADYYVRAPFDGTVAKVAVKKYDTASSGTAVVTLITAKKIAQISLNEVDAAKVKVGQKATITFDAIDGLTISGEVTDVDTIGTVSQGVVTYNVQIGFDTEDSRVKPGMSVSAAIITDVKPDVLAVPSGAIKVQGNTYYVEVFDQKLAVTNQGVTSQTPPRQQPVEIGLADDNATEIVSGLQEGDQVVVRTITSQATTQTQTAPSLFGGSRSGGGGASGGAVRALGR